MAEEPEVIEYQPFFLVARGRVIYTGDPNGTPESRLEFRGSPIHLAAVNDHDEVYGVEYLLDAGADIHSRDSTGYTALDRAAFHGNINILNTLLRRGAGHNLRDEAESMRILFGTIYTAIEECSFSHSKQILVIRSLLRARVNVNARNHFGETSLMYAAMGFNFDLLKVLLEAGADVRYRNKNNETCLHYLLSSPGKIEMMKLLVIGGASPFTENIDGIDPLHVIIYSREHSKLQKVREVKELIKISTLVYRTEKMDFGIDPCFRYRIGRFSDECYDEVQTMRFITLSRRWNLCDFAVLGRGRNPKRIVDRAFEKSMELHLAIYNDYLASHFNRDYLIDKFLDKDTVIYASSALMNVVFPHHLKKGLCNSLTKTDIYNLLNVIFNYPPLLP